MQKGVDDVTAELSRVVGERTDLLILIIFLPILRSWERTAVGFPGEVLRHEKASCHELCMKKHDEEDHGEYFRCEDGDWDYLERVVLPRSKVIYFFLMVRM